MQREADAVASEIGSVDDAALNLDVAGFAGDLQTMKGDVGVTDNDLQIVLRDSSDVICAATPGAGDTGAPERAHARGPLGGLAKFPPVWPERSAVACGGSGFFSDAIGSAWRAASD